MAQGSNLDLTEEPFGSGQIGSQHLDRHLALVLEVLGQIDGRHTTFAKVAFDPVAVGERGREPGCDLRHPAKMDCSWGFGE